MLSIEHLQGEEWLVTVTQKVTTQHRVRVTDADLARFGAGKTVGELLKESFRFLLEREPNTSILSSFDLPVINRYFPEFEREINSKLRS